MIPCNKPESARSMFEALSRAATLCAVDVTMSLSQDSSASTLCSKLGGSALVLGVRLKHASLYPGNDSLQQVMSALFDFMYQVLIESSQLSQQLFAIHLDLL